MMKPKRRVLVAPLAKRNASSRRRIWKSFVASRLPEGIDVGIPQHVLQSIRNNIHGEPVLIASFIRQQRMLFHSEGIDLKNRFSGMPISALVKSFEAERERLMQQNAQLKRLSHSFAQKQITEREFFRGFLETAQTLRRAALLQSFIASAFIDKRYPGIDPKLKKRILLEMPVQFEPANPLHYARLLKALTAKPAIAAKAPKKPRQVAQTQAPVQEEEPPPRLKRTVPTAALLEAGRQRLRLRLLFEQLTGGRMPRALLERVAKFSAETARGKFERLSALPKTRQLGKAEASKIISSRT